ncbi:MAG TPA: hypothetical protein VJR92_09260 [Gemmatimonadaceae bacterium]|nr:hypothetical protein [Gemmatimonadaceae bacterium]
MAQAKSQMATDAAPQFNEATREALAALRHAADEWARGNPEEPSTEETLERVLQPFFNRRFLRRPY